MQLRVSEIVNKISKHLKGQATLLDVGAGSGVISQELYVRLGIKPTLTDVENLNKTDLPFVRMSSITQVPTMDNSFDAAIILFVLHHIKNKQDQLALLKDVARAVIGPIIVVEDTPTSTFEWYINACWDWILNRLDGVPTPFTYRIRQEWLDAFNDIGLQISYMESYRPVWPVMKMYTHTLFVINKPKINDNVSR